MGGGIDNGCATTGVRHHQDVLHLTDAASHKVRQLLSVDNEECFLRVAVRPGGCSGFAYEMYFDTSISDDDEVEEVDGVTVVVDGPSARLLSGATLDYRDGLDRSGFHIDNPNATRSCGCGQSFS